MSNQSSTDQPEVSFSPTKECEPSENSRLTSWASIPSSRYKSLAELALPEQWYYGATPPNGEEYPILKNYLQYTFKRLCAEGKIIIRTDQERNEEYAAFNTGLVDRKYESIYALFKATDWYPNYYWYLVGFVVAGEDAGKTLNRLFNPLPARADYFESRIENMLFDGSTGPLICDYTHIITERTGRLPKDFLEDNCPSDMLNINNMTLSDAYTHSDSAVRREYFRKLGFAIKGNSRIFNRLKHRLDDAVELAKKRAAWNYKTAIPTYYPKHNAGSLLLPLALTDEDHIDLALVVIRNPSGSYQGETILPLDLAYSNSRLVSRPDSDWLRTESITITDGDDEDD